MSADVASSADDTEAHHGLYFNTTKPGSSYSAVKTFTIEDNSKVKYEVDWYTGNSTGRENNYEYIQFGDKIRISYNSSYFFYLNTDGTSSTTNKIKYYKGTATRPITIIFNTATSEVEAFTFDGVDLLSSVSGKLEGSFNTVTFGFQRGGSTANWAYPNGIEKITVSECKQSVESAAYTINYMCGDDTVASTESSSVVGDEVTAQTVVYDEDGVRYLIVADNAPSMVLTASDNVLNVEVRKPYTATLNVTTTIGGTSTVATTNLSEADDKTTNWSYAYSVYVNKDGVYYVADNTESFGETGTFTDGQTIDKTVTYSKVASDVVYFREAESAVGSDPTLSGGADGHVSADNARNRGFLVGELPAGTYQFAAVVTANNRRNLVVREYVADGGDVAGSEILATLSYGTQSAAFTLSEAKSVVINGANSDISKTNQSEDFDYVVIKKVATDATLSITSAGYATFAPAGNVTIPSDVTAYTVTVNDDNATITLNEISSDAVIPAGTGVLVAGAEGEYTFNGTTADATTLAKNDLKVAGASTVADGKQYGLGLVDGKVGFYKIKSGDTMAEGKAYLEVSTTDAAKMSFFALSGEITGISTVEAAKAANGAFYTLQGVKVVKPTKGLYINNGKKVIVK